MKNIICGTGAKNFAAIVLLLFLIFGAGCLQQGQQPADRNDSLVGNDRDEHGCIGSAGYSWCEEKQKCIRQWEEPCTKLRVIAEEFPPYNFMDSSGNVTGKSTEVVREIMKRIGRDSEIEILPLSEGYSLLVRGPNVMMYSLGRTAQRENLVKWVGPVGEWEMTLYAAESASEIIGRFARASDDAEKMEIAKTIGKICVVKDDARYQLLADNNFSNLEQVLEDRDCAKKLANNEADLWFGSSTSFDGIISDANLSAAQFVPVYSVQKNPLYLAFSMDVPDSVVSEWQQTLDEIKADGTFESIQK